VYNIRNDGVYFNDIRLGPSNALYADSGELKGCSVKDGVIHRRMPCRVDLLFVAGTRIVICESKRARDFRDSTRNRKLARQLRTLRSVSDPKQDVVAVVLRGSVVDFNDRDLWAIGNEGIDVVANLVSLQICGVMLLPIPSNDADVPLRLAAYRPLLTDGSRSALVALAGSDERKVAGRSALSAIKGIGPVMERKLRERCGPSALEVLSAGEEKWKAAKVSPKVIEKLKEAGR
jgi:hypothetical protein